MMNYTIDQEVDFTINRYDTEPNMDRAMDAARQYALGLFGADEYGHMVAVEGWERSCCSIEIKFTGLTAHGGMGGWSYYYKFTAACRKNDDE